MPRALIYDQEDDCMSRSPYPLREIVPCRGRVSLKPTTKTLRNAAFDTDDLDAVCPLSDADREDLKNSVPCDCVQAQIAARIEQARKIKYGH